MNNGDEIQKQTDDIKEQLLIDKVHIPRNFVPNSGFGTITFTYKEFKIVDVKTLTTHNIAKENKKKFS